MKQKSINRKQGKKGEAIQPVKKKLEKEKPDEAIKMTFFISDFLLLFGPDFCRLS